MKILRCQRNRHRPQIHVLAFQTPEQAHQPLEVAGRLRLVSRHLRRDQSRHPQTSSPWRSRFRTTMISSECRLRR